MLRKLEEMTTPPPPGECSGSPRPRSQGNQSSEAGSGVFCASVSTLTNVLIIKVNIHIKASLRPSTVKVLEQDMLRTGQKII